MRPILFAFPLFAAACSIAPTHHADRLQEFTVPSAGLHTIGCTSHNGDIVVRGGTGQAEIRVTVKLTAYGRSQEEADARLRELEVAQDRVDGTLTLHGTPTDTQGWGCSPSFAFTIDAPREVALCLTTHNGDITVDAIDGTAVLHTHNGSVQAHVGSHSVDIETHNGSVELGAQASGPLAGTVRSHNGGIEASIGAEVATHVVAETANGQVVVGDAAHGHRSDQRHAEATFGGGGSTLGLSSHNGDVRIR